MMVQNSYNKKTIIYDGYCPLCNRAVSFIRGIDKVGKFEYLSRHDNEAKKHWTTEIDSIILVDKEKVYYKSQAAIKIATELGYPYKLLTLFKVFPKSWLNAFYDVVARNRYKWFKSKNTCKVHF